MKRILLGFMFLASLSAHAKDCEEGADNMGQIRECLFDQSYMPVEVTYNALIALLSANNESVEEIKKAQDDWLEFRDSTCDHIAENYNGNGYSSDERLSCLIESNNERVKTLTKYISDTAIPKVAKPSLTADKEKEKEDIENQQKKDVKDFLANGNAQRKAMREQWTIILGAVVLGGITLIIVAFFYFRKKSASKSPLESSLKEPSDNQTDGVKSINELDVSESWKKKFEILERAGEFKNGSYENFKSLGFMERRKIGFNFIAFIGQPFYYFFKKMWGKGWVLFGLSVLINAAITVVEIVAKIHVPNAVYQIVPAVMFAQMANYDFYRFKVHNETVWKPFLKLNKPAAYIGFAVVSIAILLGVSALR